MEYKVWAISGIGFFPFFFEYSDKDHTFVLEFVHFSMGNCKSHEANVVTTDRTKR